MAPPREKESGGKAPHSKRSPRSRAVSAEQPRIPRRIFSVTIAGTCAPHFREVREELERNFRERGEVGASVCVLLDGETVVDLWGGVADPATGRPWERDTLG